MSTKEELQDFREKLIKGMSLSFQRLLEFKKQKNSDQCHGFKLYKNFNYSNK